MMVTFFRQESLSVTLPAAVREPLFIQNVDFVRGLFVKVWRSSLPTPSIVSLLINNFVAWPPIGLQDSVGAVDKSHHPTIAEGTAGHQRPRFSTGVSILDSSQDSPDG